MKTIYTLAAVTLLAFSSFTWARLPGEFVTCTGYGESLANNKLVPVSTATISKSDLMNDERLKINFYDVVSFRITYKDGKFVGNFSQEDEGAIEHGKFEVKKFSQLGKIHRQIEYNIGDDDPAKTFWRLSVKCKIEEK